MTPELLMRSDKAICEVKNSRFRPSRRWRLEQEVRLTAATAALAAPRPARPTASKAKASKQQEQEQAIQELEAEAGSQEQEVEAIQELAAWEPVSTTVCQGTKRHQLDVAVAQKTGTKMDPW